MTNFDFLKNTPDFDTFSDVAISAENSIDAKIFWVVKKQTKTRLKSDVLLIVRTLEL